MYITQPLHRSLQCTPDKVATIFGDRRQTFAEYGERVARLAGGLRRLGVGTDDRVAILALNSDLYLECVMAVPWADGVIVPVNTRWSTAEMAYSLRDCDVEVLLVDDEFLPMVPDLMKLAESVRHVIHIGTGDPGDLISYEGLLAESEPVPDAVRCDDQLAALFYTGGTTGFPKGVMLSHRNLMISALGGAASGVWVTQGGSYLHSPPMFHLADLCLWMGHSLAGNTHVIIPAFEPLAVLEAVERHRVTDLLLVPTMLQMFVDHPRFHEFDLSSIVRICYGASPISDGVFERTAKAFPDIELVQAYGMTELSPIATLLDHRELAADDPRLRCAGRAAPHAEVRIVDPADNEVARGTVGEIVSRGGHVMLGYWKQPDATAATVRDGWMHTGDAGWMDDEGYLYVVDRIKDMIISGGENIFSAEVENALSQHPAVATCAVIGVPDDTYGERVHAVVITKPGETVTAADLRSFAKTLIAGYKAPRSVDFVDSLPMSGAGKVLKRELRERYWQGYERGVN